MIFFTLSMPVNRALLGQSVRFVRRLQHRQIPSEKWHRNRSEKERLEMGLECNEDSGR